MEMSQVLAETKAYISLLNYVMLTSMQRSVSDYVVPVKELKDKLLFESKFAGSEQQLDVVEGDIFKYIHEIWVVAMSKTIFTAISRVKAKIESRKVEEDNQ